MTRVEFTRNITELLVKMQNEGEFPVIDFVKRSTEEQKRLYDMGLSKCDGEINQSQHQFGKAMDIYFVENGKLTDPHRGWDWWHQVWEKQHGGQPMLDWDRGHFE